MLEPTHLALPARALIAMVHLRALPGTPRAGLSVPEIARIARSEAAILRDAGFDALLVENMHDAPYLKRRVGPEVVAAMTLATAAVVEEARGLPVGVQVLAGANRESLAIALAAGAHFIRAEGFAFAHVADEGLIESDAGELLRYRRALGADHIAVFADIKKKHSSHAITADVSLAETAKAAAFFGADGLVVTGAATGDAAHPDDITAVDVASRECRMPVGEKPRGLEVATDALAPTLTAALPVLVGSGATPANIQEIWQAGASGVIIGSALKINGHWAAELDPQRAAAFVRAARS